MASVLTLSRRVAETTRSESVSFFSPCVHESVLHPSFVCFRISSDPRRSTMRPGIITVSAFLQPQRGRDIHRASTDDRITTIRFAIIALIVSVPCGRSGTARTRVSIATKSTRPFVVTSCTQLFFISFLVQHT